MGGDQIRRVRILRGFSGLLRVLSATGNPDARERTLRGFGEEEDYLPPRGPGAGNAIGEPVVFSLK